MLSCDKGELRVYSHSSCRREGQRGCWPWAGEAARAGGGGRPGQCPPLLDPSAPIGCPWGGFPQSPRFSARLTLAHAPVRSTAMWPLLWWARGTGWPPDGVLCHLRPGPGWQGALRAYRGELRGDAQKARGDSIPRKMSPCASKVFALGESATHRVQLP